MNIENIRKVRDAIAALQSNPQSFNMNNWCKYINFNIVCGDYYMFPISKLREGDCNTCGCIAGWAVAVLTDAKDYDDVDGFLATGARLFELSREDAGYLFAPWKNPKYDEDMNEIKLLGDPTTAGPKEAVKVLTHILETNEIDWNAAWR